ncbi:MAG: PorT family protein [Saprospiraceae bacterium]|nr:PorT family protein [Saprospiraceae bacterium]
MKNLALTIAFMGLLAFGASAQNFATGIRAGVNLTTFQNEDLEDNKYAVGINVAVPLEFILHQNFSIQPEIQFIQKGVAFEATDNITGLDLKTRFFTNYLEIPILAKGKFGSQALSGYLIAGPTFGFSTNRYAVAILDDERETEKVDFIDEGEQTDNRFDIGAAFGLGLEAGIGSNGAIVLDARYNLDFNDNTSFENDAPSDWTKTFNSGIAISLGYRYAFGL